MRYPRRYWLILLLLTAAGGAGGQTLPEGWGETLRQAGPGPAQLSRSRIFAASEVPWQQVGPRAWRQVLFSDRATLVRLRLEGGCGKPHDLKHWHPHDQLTHVLSGEVEVAVGKQIRRIGAGGYYVCQSNVPHSLVALSDRVELVEAFTPARDDFRPGARPLSTTPAPARAPLGPNELRAFVYHWFSLFDRNAPVEEFEPLLAGAGLRMKFPERTLTSKQDFRDWYAGVLRQIASASHDVLELSVRPTGKLSAEVSLRVVWRARTTDGKSIRTRVRQRWLVTRSSLTDQPAIHVYDVTVE